jgi:DNA-binding NarL/FixJ family response regulator
MRTAIRRVVDDLRNVEVCAVATNGQEAIDMALAFQPDLLIVDLVMPGLSGVEVIGVLKTKLPTAKFILFTMYEDKVGKYLTRFAGVDVVIEKSKGLSTLTEKIDAVIAEISGPQQIVS